MSQLPKAKQEIYFSFFMFTADLRPNDPAYTNVLINHLKAIAAMGYDGFDMHIAPPTGKVNFADEVDSYKRLKEAFNKAGFADFKFTTNVGTTRTFDPTSPYAEQRAQSLAYLKSRVDITAALGGKSIMSGPFLYPYGVFPTTDAGDPIVSDALQDWMQPRYRAAGPIFQELASYAAAKEIKLAIEPIKNWESPPPNMFSEALDFLDKTGVAPCGVAIDTAQIVMESQGPAIFLNNIARAVKRNQFNYVHISAPDRGQIQDCWIPWDVMLGAIKPVYQGPYLVEVFNAIPPFDTSMRMSRRRFWRPGEDEPEANYPSAYEVAKTALAVLRSKLNSHNQ